MLTNYRHSLRVSNPSPLVDGKLQACPASYEQRKSASETRGRSKNRVTESDRNVKVKARLRCLPARRVPHGPSASAYAYPTGLQSWLNFLQGTATTNWTQKRTVQVFKTLFTVKEIIGIQQPSPFACDLRSERNFHSSSLGFTL